MAGSWQANQNTFPYLSNQPPLQRPGKSFYDPLSNARPYIELINQPQHQAQEGPTQDAWQLITAKYFPDEEPVAPNSNYFVTWAVIREGYRRADEHAPLNKPDVIAIKTQTIQQGGGLVDAMRDMLTVECKNPNEHTQGGWKTLLEESIDRLKRYSPNQSTFLIAAVGSFYMFFFWDHTVGTSQGVASLTICINNGSDRYQLDRRLRPLGNAPWFSNNNRTSGRPARSEIRWDIDHEHALSILGNDHINPAGVISLENFLPAVRGAQLHGPNVFG